MVRRPRAPLTRATVTCLTAAFALLAGACGSSQPTNVSLKLVSAAGATRVSDAWPLADHVVTPAVFPGFVRPAPPTIISSASAWAAVERSASPWREVARLRSLGFVGAIDEHLHARFPGMAEAISIAERYRSPAGARAELAHQYGQLKRSRGASVSTFTVGIPGGHGIRVAGDGIVGLNVVFSAGPYYYIIGAGYPPDAVHAPSAARVLMAAKTLYLAVTGCAAGGEVQR
jgi:hypothetical protein